MIMTVTFSNPDNSTTAMTFDDQNFSPAELESNVRSIFYRMPEILRGVHMTVACIASNARGEFLAPHTIINEYTDRIPEFTEEATAFFVKYLSDRFAANHYASTRPWEAYIDYLCQKNNIATPPRNWFFADEEDDDAYDFDQFDNWQ